jgi:hypothetical protein
MNKTDNDDLQPEYDLDCLKNGVQGKYRTRYTEGNEIVVIESDRATKNAPTDRAP